MVRRLLQYPLISSSTDYSVQGDAIAIVWDDRSIEIISARTGKVIDRFHDRPHHSPDSKQTARPHHLTDFHWSHHVIEPRMLLDTWPLIQQGGRDPNELALLTSQSDQKPSNITAMDLPRLLALIDLEEHMPRLSPLPHVNDRHVLALSSDLFTNQATLDSSFVPPSLEATDSNTIENLSAYWADEEVSHIFRSIQIKSRNALPSGTAISSQASHPLCSSLATISQNLHRDDDRGASDDGAEKPKVTLSLQLTSFDALKKSGRYFLFVERKTHELQLLCAYVLQCVAAIRDAWNSGQEIPSRFINIVREALAQMNFIDVDAALYHQAVTEDALEPVREWLTDTVQDRVRCMISSV